LFVGVHTFWVEFLEVKELTIINDVTLMGMRRQ
jgi:hypothetical protein